MTQQRSSSIPALARPPKNHTYFTQEEATSEHALRSSVPRHLFNAQQHPVASPPALTKAPSKPPRTTHPRQHSFYPTPSTTQSARILSINPHSGSPHNPTTSTRFLADDHTGTPSPVADTIRRPIIYQAKYGSPVNWSMDPFTLPHNAIRAECVDLYNILESIQARSHGVDALELEEFHIWWKTFEIFIIEYFDFEADVIYPWVFARTPASPSLSSDLTAQKLGTEVVLKNSLLSTKEALLDAIRQLNGTFDLRRNVDTADVFTTILEEVNQFVPNLLEYFHMQERHLPSIVERYYSASSKEMIVKRYLQYIKKGENPHMNLVLLSRWMDSDVKEKWLRAHVRGLTRILHKRWERRCNRTHGHIAYKFHRRLLRSVRSVAASRLRRRTEFGEEVDDVSFSSFASLTGSIRSLNFIGQSKQAASPRSGRRSRDAQRSRSRLR